MSATFHPGDLVRKRFQTQPDPEHPNHKHPGPLMKVTMVTATEQRTEIGCQWQTGSDQIQTEQFRPEELEHAPEEWVREMTGQQ